VVPTHARPEEMRRAVSAILAQDYPGEIEVVVVYDKSNVDTALPGEWPGRSVRVISNSRTPGLAGARNTGFLVLDTDLVASCDDDDRWEPGKLRAQVEALLAQPGAQFVTTGMVVDYERHSNIRLAGKDRVTYPDLLRSRMAMLHSSSFVMRRDALLDSIGLVDEDIPRSFVEDWDLLLRAARQHPIVHVDRPLTRVLFQGKIAFYSAMMGRRRDALDGAKAAMRSNWREPRAVLALAVASGAVDGSWLMSHLNRRGHGI
jgi:glycosyltransferase involved in cell wall biosynthesis